MSFTVFEYHWYVKTAPVAVTDKSVGVALRQTVCVAVGCEVRTVTGLTVIVIPADVAVVGLAHVAFEVITTVIASPLVNVELLYVKPFSPIISIPPFFH